MPLHLSDLDPETIAALGLSPIMPAPTPIFAAVMASETPPETPVHAPHTPRDFTPPASTQAYALLRAASALSAARYGAPMVARVTGGYAIRCAPALAYGVDITQPLVTVVSLKVYAASKWRTIEVLRLAKLTPHELLSLFVTGKE